MKVFLASGPGHYLGATFVIIAKDLEQATFMARTTAHDRGLPFTLGDGSKDFKLRQIPTDTAHVPYIDDGDY